MAFKDNKIKGIISNNTGNGIHSFGSFQYFQYTDPVLIDPATNAPLVVDVATAVGFFSSNDSGSNLTEIVLSPSNISISANEATLSNITVWSANSILTQGRGDARYQPIGSYLANATTWLTTDSGTDQIIGLQSNTSTYQTFSGTGVFGSSYLGVRTLASNTAISYIKCDPIAAPFGRVTIFHNGTTFTFNSRGISVGSTANFTWGSNDFSTVGFNDARYQNATNNTYANLTGTPNLSLYYLANNPTGYITASCLTYGNISGTPNLSLYLTTANAATTYLPSANFTYANIGGTIPTATNTTLGAVKVGSNLTISNGVLSATSSGGFQNGDTLNGGTY